MNYPLKAKYRGIVFFGNNEEVIKNAILKKFPNCLEDLEYISVTKNNPTVNDYKAPAKEKKKLSFKDGVTGAYALFKVATGSVVDQNELNMEMNDSALNYLQKALQTILKSSRKNLEKDL